MTENNDKREVEHIDTPNPFGPEQKIIRVSTKATRTSDVAYDVALRVPVTDEEATDFYNLVIQNLIEAGLRNVAYRMNFKEVFNNHADESGRLPTEAVEKLQRLADDYRAGTRATGGPSKSQKSKAKKMDEAMSEAGVANAEEILELIRKAKAAGITLG